MKYEKSELLDAFGYLDRLRESGSINMFGAAPYLAKAFDLDKNDSYTITKGWMKTFDETATVENRVEKFMASI